MKNDLLLIFPSHYKMSNSPIGIAYIASYIKNKGIKVKLSDIGAEIENPIGNVNSIVKKHDPKIIGISTPSLLWKNTKTIAKKIKKEFPNQFLVVGGPHPSGYKGQILKEVPEIDAVIYGEGEITTLELCESIINKKPLSKINGLIYRKGKKIIKNMPRELIRNLDLLPFPARDLLQIEKYDCLGIVTSRGCPYSCTFCDKSAFGKAWRARSAKNIVDEIEFLAKNYSKMLNKTFISIRDDVFNLNIKRVKEICDEIIKRRIKVNIKSINGIRADRINKELLKKMKSAGWTYIQYGIETANQEILDRIKKGETIEQIKQAIKLTKEVGIDVGGSFIIDLPGSTKENSKKTLDLIKELQLDSCSLNFLTPIPNTEVWRWAHSDDNVKIIGDVYRSRWDKPVIETKEFNAEDKLEVFKKAATIRNKILLKRYIRRIFDFKRYKKIKTLNQIKNIYKNFYNLILNKDVKKI